VEKIADQLMVFATDYGLKIIGAIVILIVGRIAAGMFRKFVIKLMRKAKTDESLISFVDSLSFIMIIVFTVIASLAKFGVQTTSFVAVLGAVGFAIGFALQVSLANFASGILLLLFRPLKVGDMIEAAGSTGIVQEIRIFNTVLRRWITSRSSFRTVKSAEM